MRFLATLALLLLPISATAQITITEEMIFGFPDAAIEKTEYSVESATGFEAILAATGENQTWDFTGFPFDESISVVERRYPFDETLPAADNELFDTATHVWQLDFYPVPGQSEDTTQIFGYGNLTDGTHTRLGEVIELDLDGDGIKETASLSWWDPGSVDIKLPVEYGDTWSDSSGFWQELPPVGLVNNLYRVMTQSVTGWGTLITPAGTTSALRITQEVRAVTPVTGFEVKTTTDVFTDAAGSEARITKDHFTGETEVAYLTWEQPGSVGIPVEEKPSISSLKMEAAYPNPSSSSVSIPFEVGGPTPITMSIFNPLGQEVARIADQEFVSGGRYVRTWDPRALPAGPYIIRLVSEEGVRSASVVLTR